MMRDLHTSVGVVDPEPAELRDGVAVGRREVVRLSTRHLCSSLPSAPLIGGPLLCFRAPLPPPNFADFSCGFAVFRIAFI